MRDALRGLPGVAQVSLEFDPAGRGVLRVRLAPGVNESEVVSAALASLRASHGVGSDGLGADGSRLRLTGPTGEFVVAVVEPHGRPPAAPPPVVWQPLQAPPPPASASAPPSPPAPPPPTPAPDPAPQDDGVLEGAGRLVLVRVEVASERMQMWATVHLARDEYRFSGSAGATASGAGAHRAVAEATVRAAESALGGDVRLDVEGVDLIAVGQDQIGVVILTLVTDGGVDRLTGAALVRGDGRETIVRATLDALNRRAESPAVERRPRTRGIV